MLAVATDQNLPRARGWPSHITRKVPKREREKGEDDQKTMCDSNLNSIAPTLPPVTRTGDRAKRIAVMDIHFLKAPQTAMLISETVLALILIPRWVPRTNIQATSIAGSKNSLNQAYLLGWRTMKPIKCQPNQSIHLPVLLQLLAHSKTITTINNKLDER